MKSIVQILNLRRLRFPWMQPWFDAKRYEADYQSLSAREKPYFAKTGACGHCGASDDLSDAAWFDFRSYIQYKAIARQLPDGPRCEIHAPHILN